MKEQQNTDTGFWFLENKEEDGNFEKLGKNQSFSHTLRALRDFWSLFVVCSS